jgi:DNA-binding transcriptional LysR family regulator
MNWEDLRYILAVSREGTLLAAASSLGVSPTTMSRRLRKLEESQGTALFEKFKHGAVLTGAGERVVVVAESVERLTHELDAEIHGLDTKLGGTIRVTSTEMLTKHFLVDFGAFRALYPGIEIELDSKTSLANMTQREADVAIRLGHKAPDHLIGNRYASVGYAVFGGAELVGRIGRDAAYGDYPWVGWDRAINRSTDAWMSQHAPGATVVMRFGSMPVIAHAVSQGVGLAVLPCVIGDADANLRRVGGYFTASDLQVWLLTHPKLRGTARIKVFLAFMRNALRRDADLFTGDRPRV